MPDVKLLSNGKYHVLVDGEGSGYSRWNGLAVTRWREDSALESGGTFFYLRDGDDGSVWSATPRPVEPGGGTVTVRFDAGSAVFTRRDHGFEVTTTVVVDPDHDVELRRMRIRNISARQRALPVTSFAELVLAPPATDAAHPAFSKIFVETELDSGLEAIIATRRPSSPDEMRSWCFHRAVADGSSAAGKGSRCATASANRPTRSRFAPPSVGAAQVVLDAVVVPDGVIALVDDGKTHAVVVDAWQEHGTPAASTRSPQEKKRCNSE